MNKYKKSRSLSLLMIAALLFVLSACDSSTEKAEGDTTSEDFNSSSIDSMENEGVMDSDAEDIVPEINIVYLPVSEISDEAVRSYTYSSEKRTLVGVEISAEGENRITSSVTYNEYGEVIEQVWYGDDGSISSQYRYSYDNTGNVIEYYKENLIGASREIYTYDEEGNEIELIYYSLRDGVTQTMQKFSYSYNERGDIAESIEYNEDGSVKEITSLVYDEHGYLVKEVRVYYDDGDEAREYIYIYENTYDEQGQIVQTIEYDERGALWNRTTYSEHGVAEELYYDSDGTIDCSYFYDYDELGVLIRSEEIQYSEAGELYSDEVKTYDDDGNLTGYYEYANDGEIEYQYTCEYDENGNLIKKVFYDEVNSSEATVTCTWQAIEFKSR